MEKIRALPYISHCICDQAAKGRGLEGLSSLILPPKHIESMLVMAQFKKRPCEGGCFSFLLLLGHSSHNPLLCSFTQTSTLWLCPASEKGPCGQRQKALSCLLGLRSELTASDTQWAS